MLSIITRGYNNIMFNTGDIIQHKDSDNNDK